MESARSAREAVKQDLLEEGHLQCDWPRYSSLIQLLCRDEYTLVSGLCHVTDVTEADSVAKALVCVCLRHGDVLGMVRTCVRAEFEANASRPAQIFRTQNLASRVLGTHARLVGAGYLQHTLRAVVTALVMAQVNLEVDPARMSGGGVDVEALQEQRGALELWAELFVTRLTDATSMHEMPEEMRTCFLNQTFRYADHSAHLARENDLLR